MVWGSPVWSLVGVSCGRFLLLSCSCWVRAVGVLALVRWPRCSALRRRCRVCSGSLVAPAVAGPPSWPAPLPAARARFPAVGPCSAAPALRSRVVVWRALPGSLAPLPPPVGPARCGPCSALRAPWPVASPAPPLLFGLPVARWPCALPPPRWRLRRCLFPPCPRSRALCSPAAPLLCAAVASLAASAAWRYAVHFPALAAAWPGRWRLRFVR